MNIKLPPEIQKELPRKIVRNIILFITLFGILLVFGYYNQVKILKDDVRQIAVQFDNFIQIGELFISNFAHPDLINLETEQQFEQFKKDLLPFPFFTQLSLYSPEGSFVTGFPNDLIQLGRQNIVTELLRGHEFKTDLLVSFSNYQSDYSNLFFIKTIQNPGNSKNFYLVGETDWRTNPINLNLMDSIEELNKSMVSVIAIDNNDGSRELLGLSGDESDLSSRAIIVLYPLETRNWVIVLNLEWKNFMFNVINASTPFILLFLFCDILLSYLLLTKKISFNISVLEKVQKNVDVGFSKSRQKKDLLSPKEFYSTEYLQDFIKDIAKLNKTQDICRVLIKFASKLQATSIRILLFKNPYLPTQGIHYLNHGEKSKNYEYLDDQVIAHVISGQRISISDIRKVPLINLSDGKPYPLSIYVFPVKGDDVLLGALWVGYENIHQILKEEYEYILKIIEIASPLLSMTIMGDVLNEIVTEQDTILELLQIPIIILDEDKIVIHINKYAIYLDEGFNNCIGKQIDNIRLNKKFQDAISQSMENQREVEIVLPDNRIFHLKTFKKETNKKKILQILIFQEKTEENLLKKQVSDNVSLLSQSMLTPILNVKGYSNMLSMLGELNDQQKDYINKMSTNIENMLTHVKNLLDFDRVESKKNLQLQDVDFVQVIKKVLDSLDTNISQKQIEMKIDFKGNSELRIMADSYLLERAIFNLVENSIRFSERNSSVSIEMDKNEQYVTFKVKDSGSGISQIDIPHIFEKYYKVKIDSALENKGSGIGLYFVKTIIDQHKGRIGITSSLGKGTEFIVELPVV